MEDKVERGVFPRFFRRGATAPFLFSLILGENNKAMVPKGVENQPVYQIWWIHRSQIKPNLYNPNHVAPPEMELLKTSILEDGWTQPVVLYPPVLMLPGMNTQGMEFTLIDGYHRYLTSGDAEVAALTQGYVPSVMVRPGLDAAHRMMSTIRHNRARGTHAVLKMAEIVQFMQDQGVPAEEIMARLSMEDEEVNRLLAKLGRPARFAQDGVQFGNAWVPDGSGR